MKQKDDLACQIIKGMAKNEEKVIKDSFAQRLKANIMRQYKGEDVEINFETLTDYLNKVVKKSEIKVEDVRKEYDS